MCAIFGMVADKEASNLTYLGLHAQQHRGQEGAGIISTDGEFHFVHRRKGLVADVFNTGALAKLVGNAAIGHTRYSTAGSNSVYNLQPILMNSALGWFSLAHNGNLVNAPELSKALVEEGSIFHSTSDTEVILHLMARSRKKTVEDALVTALEKVVGAYSILALSKDKIIALRDPHGFRPLVMGELNGLPVFASETCAFALIGAKFVREIEPGEILITSIQNPKDSKSLFPWKKEPTKKCVFEHVYFARPDSEVYQRQVHDVRKRLGQKLAEEQPAPGADVVIPVPDSGVPAAIGYSQASGIPFDVGIIRSHYIGRTFIEPQQSIRDFGVKLKLSPVVNTVKGKKIVVVDDSIVRGTTSKKLIQHLRDAGAKEVHLRISAPPTTHPCYYGIDTPTKKELLASGSNIEFIRKYIGADSVGYLSLKGLLDAVGDDGFCHACFSGEYPTHIPAQDVSRH